MRDGWGNVFAPKDNQVMSLFLGQHRCSKTKMVHYLSARFIYLAAAFGVFFFDLLLRSSGDNLIYGGEVVYHAKKPLPAAKSQNAINDGDLHYIYIRNTITPLKE